MHTMTRTIRLKALAKAAPLLGALWLAAAGCSVPSEDLATRRASLLQYPGCTELGATLTDHACFHANFGPFVTVAASAVRDFGAATPNVNSVHTHYTVTLPGAPGVNEGTVKYRPARTGN